jgi:hypothetical protein
MTEQGYNHYLATNDKKEIRRTHVVLKDPAAALLKLEELLSKKWSWWVLPNNCARFVEDVVQAGGADVGLLSNCPALENFQ